jgi:hypothetical protein
MLLGRGALNVYGSLLYMFTCFTIHFLRLPLFSPFPCDFPMALWCLGELERLNSPSRI